MTKTLTYTLAVLAAVGVFALGFTAGVKNARDVLKEDSQAGAGVRYDASKLVGDVYNGVSETKMMSGGYFVGPINTSNDVTMTGTLLLDSIGQGPLEISATTTPQTLTAAQICTYNSVNWPASTSTGSITLPSASALQADCLDEGYRDVVFMNNSASATSSYSITAGASTTLVFASGTANAAVLSGDAVSLRFLFATASADPTMIRILSTSFK